jgi:predicted membrane protein
MGYAGGVLGKYDRIISPSMILLLAAVLSSTTSSRKSLCVVATSFSTSLLVVADMITFVFLWYQLYRLHRAA